MLLLLLKNEENSEIVEHAEEMLVNFSEDDIKSDTKVRVAKTEIGKLCFENNVNIFSIIPNEQMLS